jgi:N-acetylglucosamine-6-phosphate deacetylase
MIVNNVKVYLEDEIISNGWIEFKDGVITDYGNGHKEGIDGQGYHLLPGFIDQHTHGCVGYDFMDGDVEGIKKMLEYVVSEGTTSILATTMTQDKEVIKDALKVIKEYTNTQNENQAQIVGVHLEGPFISEEYKGAQYGEFIQVGTKEVMSEYQQASGELIKMVTYAPEFDVDGSFTTYLNESGILPSIGHSGASMDECMKAHKHGATCMTHFHNGMSPHHHRKPGAVSAGFYADDITVELIVDGIHLNKDVVKMVYKLKGYERIVLVTDSMRAKGLPEGNYELGGQKVTVENGEARLVNGTLAGSVLRMDDAFNRMKLQTGAKLHELMYMTSINPAKQLGLFDSIGSIAKGKQADFVLLDETGQVRHTFVKGNKVYSL